ncbi:hypothetical protein H4R33_006977 [Dimargaris cristalligena]|nr:hypothetical protein H4R33_006977 [Dimargaris cristalligena]
MNTTKCLVVRMGAHWTSRTVGHFTTVAPSTSFRYPPYAGFSTYPAHCRDSLSKGTLTGADPFTNALKTHELLTEAYCWDHSSPNTGASEVDLQAKARQPSGEAVPRTPFPSGMDPALAYLEEVLREGQRENPHSSHMMVSPLSGLTLYWLVTLLQPRRILEIGSFIGYSALWMAEGLKRNLKGSIPDHPLITCELNPQNAQSVRSRLARFKMEPWVQVMEGPALDTLKTRIAPGTQFDFIFMDANKNDYINYYNYILESDMLSAGGLLAVDNTLFHGKVFHQYPAVQGTLEKLSPAAPPLQSEDPRRARSKAHRYIYEFNKAVAEDPRTEQLILPMFDGLTLIRLRPR